MILHMEHANAVSPYTFGPQVSFIRTKQFQIIKCYTLKDFGLFLYKSHCKDDFRYYSSIWNGLIPLAPTNLYLVLTLYSKFQFELFYTLISQMCPTQIRWITVCNEMENRAPNVFFFFTWKTQIVKWSRTELGGRYPPPSSRNWCFLLLKFLKFLIICECMYICIYIAVYSPKVFKSF